MLLLAVAVAVAVVALGLLAGFHARSMTFYVHYPGSDPVRLAAQPMA